MRRAVPTLLTVAVLLGAGLAHADFGVGFRIGAGMSGPTVAVDIYCLQWTTKHLDAVRTATGQATLDTLTITEHCKNLLPMLGNQRDGVRVRSIYIRNRMAQADNLSPVQNAIMSMPQFTPVGQGDNTNQMARVYTRLFRANARENYTNNVKRLIFARSDWNNRQAAQSALCAVVTNPDTLAEERNPPPARDDCYGHGDLFPDASLEATKQKLRIMLNAPMEILVKSAQPVGEAIARWGVWLLLIVALFAVIHTGYKLFLQEQPDLPKIISSLTALVVITSFFGWMMVGNNWFKVITEFGIWTTDGLVVQACEAAQQHTQRAMQDITVTSLPVDQRNWCADRSPATAQNDIFPASGMVSPGMVMVLGVERFVFVKQIADEALGDASWLTAPAVVFIYLLTMVMGLVMMILWILLGVYVLLIWMEGFLVMLLGVFMFGFGAWDMTRDKAISYVWYAVGWILRLAVLLCSFVLCIAMFSSLVPLVVADDTVGGLELFLIAVVMTLEPYILYVLSKGVMQTIGGFLGSRSDAANTMAGMFNNMASFGLKVAAGGAALGMAPVGAVGGGAVGGIGGAVKGAVGAQAGGGNVLGGAVAGAATGATEGAMAGAGPAMKHVPGGSKAMDRLHSMRPNNNE